MRNKYFDLAWKPAVVSGLFCVLFFIVMYLSGVYMFENVMGLDMFVPLPFSIIAVFYYRKYVNNGELRFWEGLLLSWMVIFVSISMLTLYLVVHFDIIDVNYLAESIRYKVNEIRESEAVLLARDFSKETIDFQIEKLNETSLSIIISSKIIWYSIIGLFYSIIISIVLRK